MNNWEDASPLYFEVVLKKKKESQNDWLFFCKFSYTDKAVWKALMKV